MKKNLAFLVLFVSFLLSAIFFCDKLMGSSIQDNTSQGIILRSTSRVYQSDYVRATEFDLPTANPAVLDEWGIGSVLEFTDATQDTSLAEFRVPLGIDSSAQPYIRIEWCSVTPDPTGDVVNVKWQIAYKWLAIDETSDSAAETTTTKVANVSSTAKGLVETDIQLAGMGASDKRLHVQFKRLGDATDDTNDGQDANIFDAGLYFIINKLGASL